jgi:hypothetical protein
LTDRSKSVFVNFGYELDTVRARRIIKEMESPIRTRAGLTVHIALGCLGEVYGINDMTKRGVTSLIKAYGTKGFKKTLIALCIRLGFNTLSGIGYGITALEVAYCIYEETHSNSRSIVPEWWNPNCGYSEEEAENVVYVILNQNLEFIFSSQPLLRKDKGIIKYEYRISTLDYPCGYFAI